MVMGFVLDYMHLVLLGVMKRLLNKIWKGPIPHRFSENQTRTFDNLTFLLARALPSEVHRKGRPLSQVSRWKAVEFRVFLLYTGPLILRNILSSEKYEHFLFLHVAIRILATPSSKDEQKSSAKQFLVYFSKQFSRIYGKENLVYNVHSLIHLADDSIVHSCHLDEISCFPFKNRLGQLVTQPKMGTVEP